MWTYEQSSGQMSRNGTRLAKGYSGAPGAVNDPNKQDQKGIGPIPQGKYSIGAPENTSGHGPYVLPLWPDPANQMFGRSGMLIHGDEVEHPGLQLASHGCVILPFTARTFIWGSGDHDLEVVSGLREGDAPAGA